MLFRSQEIPPTLHFERPNPKIDFAESPFYVNSKLSPWKSDRVRRAGVSSFGIGGTNAHVVVEEAPAPSKSGDSGPWQLLLLSSKTDTALEAMTSNLAEHFAKHPELNLADAAYTLQLGRSQFQHRRMAVCRDLADAVETLGSRDPKRVLTAWHEPGKRAVAFMFSGQGAQYVGMGRDLYHTDPRFREIVDQCSELLGPHLDCDLRDVLYPGDGAGDDAGNDAGNDVADEAARTLTQTRIAQPALFVVEYALARLWMSWGVEPQAMIGHSIGEYVAACLAGVFSLEDALALVAARGRLMQQQPPGTMLAVSLPASELRGLIDGPLSLAAINGPSLCVVSGPTDNINALEKELDEKRVPCRPLHTSHAFHSEMMDDVLERFAERVGTIRLAAPQVPLISNLTGTWIRAKEATDPGFWSRHLRQTVLFADGVQELLKEPSRVLLEVGPGTTLSTLAALTLKGGGEATRGLSRFSRRENGTVPLPTPPTPAIVASMRHPRDPQSDVQALVRAAGQLWLSGVEVDWSKLHENHRRRRVSLPTYPFERKRFWVDPIAPVETASARPRSPEKKADVADWFHVPTWRRSVHPGYLKPCDPLGGEACWLIFADARGWGAQRSEECRVGKECRSRWST